MAHPPRKAEAPSEPRGFGELGEARRIAVAQDGVLNVIMRQTAGIVKTPERRKGGDGNGVQGVPIQAV